MSLTADTPVEHLKGVGPRVAERLAGLHIYTLQDMLFHLPLRYQDRSRVFPLGALHHGMEVVVQGEILLTEIKYAKRRMLLVKIADQTGSLLLRFFHFSQSQLNNLSIGRQIRCFGEARAFNSNVEMAHPEYEFVSDNASLDTPAYLTPIYSLCEGLSQISFRKLFDQLVIDHRQLRIVLPEYMDQTLLQDIGIDNLSEAIAYCHKPPSDTAVEHMNNGDHPVQERLAFEELLSQHLSLKQIRHRHRRHLAPSFTSEPALQQRFIANLPYTLTAAQLRVYTEIQHDLKQSVPTMRLIQGDVGSGKTVVAALAAVQAIDAGFQVLIMAPTEILAEQHLHTFTSWFQALDLQCGLLTGKLGKKQRTQIMSTIESGSTHLVVGTHALFQDHIEFNNVGLIIIDEQHRFGVHQRLALRNKGLTSLNRQNGVRHPHQIIMTATPIPRTLMMTAYADLDCSIIDELPPGRKPIETVVIAQSRRVQVLERVHGVCREGRQCYWVCTLIEESEALQCQAAQTCAEDLQACLTNLNVGLVHGRMNSKQKSQVMAEFSAGDIDLLVATTVIEVGVDVPNATLMIIENAERLGLSQLHQLRGRVGRSDLQSHCVLLYKAPISQLAKSRLGALRESNDGFQIARVDLALRGPGEMLGTRQTGLAKFRVADLTRHQHLLSRVSAAAKYMENQTPENIEPLIRRWVGERQDFVNA
ncbi:MAG: ATP-dependent DNA helicase RecG [Thiohalomonadales bacterium]